MTTPAHCTSCGHELGVGRFCTNCGRPVPGRHPEAEPVVDVHPATTVITPAGPAGPPPPPPTTPPPTTPPPVGSVPPAARFPLFADEDAAPVTVLRPFTPASPPVPAPPDSGSRSMAWWPWIVAIVVLGLVAGLGSVLLLGGDDDGEARDPDSPSASARASGDSTDASVTPGLPDGSVDVTSAVSAEVPAVAPASADLAGRRVTFVAANMWDGKPSTAWRMPGDGRGETLVFTLAEATELTEVGLINGYAKIDQGTDWYRGNRRIRQVEWEFDDGTVVTQDLVEDPSLQTLTVDPVTTSTIRLRLVKVSKPGKGANGRDNTAISEVRFVGSR